MIQLTRLNHVPLILNSDLIEHIEVTPDTVITLTTGQRFLVLESAEEVVDKVIWFRREIAKTGSYALPQQRMLQVQDEDSGKVTESNGG